VIYLVRMRPKFRAAAVALVLVGALSASGCASEAPAADPTPTPRATPLFASDEEALAAAEEAYAAYLAVTDEIFADGGNDVAALSTVATGKQLSDDTAGFFEIRERGYRSVGSTSFTEIELQQYEADADALQSVATVYLCEDVSKIDVFDGGGVSVVQPDRPDRTKFEVTFDRSGSSSAGLLVASREVWAGGAC